MRLLPFPKDCGPRRRGFTLVEALAAAALLGVGITAAMSALGAVAKSEGRAREHEKLQRMAIDKYDELTSTFQPPLSSQSGDFSDRNIQGYTWNLDVATSNVVNLSTVKLTVQKQNASKSDPSAVVEGLLYQPPNTTTAGVP